MFPVAQPRHEAIAAQPRYYDIAFGNRDLEVECGFLEYLSRNLGRGRLESFVEIFCGPGYHLHHLAAQGCSAYGIEPNAELVAYAEEKALMMAPPEYGPPEDAAPVSGRESPREPHACQGQVLLADPRDFALPEAVDLAFCPNQAFRYLLRNEDVIAHLVAVAKNLGRGGLYVIEAEHPRVLCGRPDAPVEAWEVTRNETTVRVRMQSGHHALDPITQVRDLSIALEVQKGDHVERFEDTAPVRAFSYQELRALVKLSGVFDWVATFGDLSITQPFDASEGARRTVPVLRCSV